MAKVTRTVLRIRKGTNILNLRTIANYLPGTLTSGERKWEVLTHAEFLSLFDLPTTGADMVLRKH